MPHLITGATGALGGAIIAAIKSQGLEEHFILGARRTEALDDTGFEVRHVDYDDVDTLHRSFSNIETLLLVSSNAPNAVRKRQHRAVIQAASARGVERIVFTSLLGADDPGDNKVLDVYHDAEQALQAQALRHVIMRNGVYLDALPSLMGGFEDTGTVAMPSGSAPVSWVSRSDIASFALEIMLDPGAEGVFAIAAPGPCSMPEAITCVSRHTGVPIAYIEPTRHEYIQRLVSKGLPETIATTFAEVCRALATGKVVGSSEPFSRRMGRPAEGLASFVARTFVAGSE
ncbi:MAG: NAD(P)H-binding protein [Myxococcota bacterium]